MAKLSGLEISRARDRGDVIIDPFDQKCVGPNSYDLTLFGELKTYKQIPDYHGGGIVPLDVKRENYTESHLIDEYGYILQPNTLYLGCTNEVAGSTKYVPCIEGRSSMARLGIKVHFTAGFGDVGFVGQWTLEIECVQPVRIYKDMRICQVYFDTIEGEIGQLYAGKYNGSVGAIASRSYEDYGK